MTWRLDDAAFRQKWLAACDTDAVLAAWAGPWDVCFALRCDDAVMAFRFAQGRFVADTGEPAFTLSAPASVWEKFLLPVPPRHHHAIFAMRMRVPEFAVLGDELCFAQHVHLARRVLEIGKHLMLGGKAPAPAWLHPHLPVDWVAEVQGAYVPVTVGATTYNIHYQRAGQGRDVLCLHTAGADGRQFHRLMMDESITRDHRLVAFDLPWHGGSPPPAGGIPCEWRLDTDLYVALIMGFVRAARLNRPIVVGASMSGEICLELAYRHPEAFTAIVACEASEKIEGRKVAWAAHPAVNQAYFIPEWILGLCAPQSPTECVMDIYWGYAQGGPNTFAGDIHFYSGEWDARERVGRIDTNICPLFMLTGEYDYSCTAEHSAATAAKIPGVRFQVMEGMGHFPFAENPKLFAQYLRPILDQLR
jgi:pimeloyl-ACP methyl ester carboxylesterase